MLGVRFAFDCSDFLILGKNHSAGGSMSDDELGNQPHAFCRPCLFLSDSVRTEDILSFVLRSGLSFRIQMVTTGSAVERFAGAEYRPFWREYQLTNHRVAFSLRFSFVFRLRTFELLILFAFASFMSLARRPRLTFNRTGRPWSHAELS